jgi:TonB family protein
MKPHAINIGLMRRLRCLGRSSILILVILLFGFNDGISAKIPVSAADSIYQIVDKQPVYQGRPSNIHKFIKSNLVYPDNAWLNNIEGVVQVSFVVTKDGKIINSKIEKSVSAELDMEALRLVDMLENWKPGKKDGAVVHTYVSIPIEFSIKPDEKEFIGMLQKYGLNENPPMYILDDKIINSRIHLPSYNLESVRVVKGAKAIEKYGESAKNGVVIFTTKRGTPPVW